jgi:hypothetical protein
MNPVEKDLIREAFNEAIDSHFHEFPIKCGPVYLTDGIEDFLDEALDGVEYKLDRHNDYSKVDLLEELEALKKKIEANE